jgi:hypothetical protein
MKKVFMVPLHERITVILTCLIAVCLFSFSCHETKGYEIIEKKMPTILVNLLKSDDPIGYAKSHGINLKDGAVRVIITMDRGDIPKNFLSEHGLKDYQWREDLATGYISIEGLKELCEEPSVIYIRLPVDLMGRDDLNNTVE